MIYKDRAYTPEERATDLLSFMTVDEKIDQMILTMPETFLDNINTGRKARIYGATFLANSLISADELTKIHRYIKENTRLGIPLLITGEGLHGVYSPYATIFPQAMGLGCSFNEGLIGEIADAIGGEARALGIRQLFAPNLDLARELRWGRVEETYGEDPYLSAKLGVAYVKNLQKRGVAATIKHYMAHGSPEGGLNLAPVHAGERELRELYIEPFREALVGGGAMSVMPAYSELDGIPVHSSKFLLRKILRDELGFKGVIISDFDGVRMLNYLHKTVASGIEAGKAVLAAGIDIEAPLAYGYGDDFRKAVKEGEIDITLVDEAVLRILTLKFKLGLFDEDKICTKDSLRAPETKALAKKAALESVVLLKNDGTLPLGEKSEKIALIGPNADTAELGDYTYYQDNNAEEKTVTLKTALIKRLGQNNVNFAEGSSLLYTDENMLSEAEQAAKKSDVVILALGESSHAYSGGTAGGGQIKKHNATSCGEGFDVSDLSLSKAQKVLFGRVANVGKPIVLILYTGRPYAIAEECNGAAAVLQAWYPGEQGGEAITELLLGDVSPSGKLSVSFPRSVGHLPCFYNYKPSARGFYKKPGTLENPGRDYVFDNPSALFEFGYGLSYSMFEYSSLKAETETDGINVTVNVENIGAYNAYESVLLFLSMKNCPVTQPVKRLRAFKKIYLNKREKVTVAFKLTREDFSYIDEYMFVQLCRGSHTISIDKLTCEIKF